MTASIEMSRRKIMMGAGAVSLAAIGSSCAPTRIGRMVPPVHGAVQGYRGLADLPWFELDKLGRLVLERSLWEELPWGVDSHTHLGMSFMFRPPLDYHAEYPKTKYLMDCDGASPDGCELQFDDYLNKIGTPAMLHKMEKALVSQVLTPDPVIDTHTIPNLAAELDRMKMGRAVLLAVVPRLPFRNNPTESWIEALKSSEHRDRFILFAGIHVRDAGAEGQLRAFHKAGARGVKLHPPMQHFYPDEDAAMRVYEVCQDLSIPVFFHAGRAGIELKYSQKFAVMQRYEAAVREFPKLKFVFGHAGARDWRDALKLAERYENISLEIEGQGVSELKKMLASIGSERLLFGSDWPFYPLAATVARVLLATKGDKQARNRILGENGRKLLKI